MDFDLGFDFWDVSDRVFPETAPALQSAQSHYSEGPDDELDYNNFDINEYEDETWETDEQSNTGSGNFLEQNFFLS